MILKASSYSGIRCWKMELPFSIYKPTRITCVFDKDCFVDIAQRIKIGGFGRGLAISHAGCFTHFYRCRFGATGYSNNSRNWSGNI